MLAPVQAQHAPQHLLDVPVEDAAWQNQDTKAWLEQALGVLSVLPETPSALEQA